MTLNELIERLQDMRQRLSDGDVEVLVVHQPGYPLKEVISGVWMPEDDQSGSCIKCGRILDNGECPACDWTPDSDKEQFVYVLANGHHQTASPYSRCGNAPHDSSLRHRSSSVWPGLRPAALPASALGFTGWTG